MATLGTASPLLDVPDGVSARVPTRRPQALRDRSHLVAVYPHARKGGHQEGKSAFGAHRAHGRLILSVLQFSTAELTLLSVPNVEICPD